MRSSDMKDLSFHPCFTEGAHGRYGRLHVPCAPECDLSCAFCGRGLDEGDKILPGRAMRIVRPEEAEEYIREKLAGRPEIRVIGVAGPGEPLFNEETFRVLDICRRAFPDMILCIGSNGLLLAKNAERLRDLGVSTVTVTVNSLDPAVLTRLVPRICLSESAGEEKVWADGPEAARLLIDRQLEGIRLCAFLGMTVKVNTVLVPGINDGGVEGIARKAAELGASVQNIMPLIPAGRLSGLKAPDRREVRALQDRLDPVIRQFRSCAGCRADACGLLSEGAGQSGCIK